MLKDIILKQKSEKERLLSLQYIERAKASETKKWLDSDLTKVILGPRRAGKSVFALMLLKDRPFGYFNFDDEGISGEGTNYDELMKELHLVFGETRTLLFDEIQNLPRWELFVSRLQRAGYNLVLTGSNAKLLSKELSTALTGRHIPVQILPFSFKEFLQAKKYTVPLAELSLPREKARFLGLLKSYVTDGGYPEVVVKGLDASGYLGVLFDSVLFKDVVKRHKVRFSGAIDNLGSYLINNVASPYSLRKLTNVLSFRSGVTLEKYLGYLIEAYMVFSLNRYSHKAGERIRSPKKVYVVDNGFVGAKAVRHSPDSGALMENLVFTELVKRDLEPNRDFFYYKTRNNREIDFVIKRGTEVEELVQVVYEVNFDTEQREIKALVEASHELHVKKLTVLTWDEKKQVEKGDVMINFIPLWEWLL